MKVNNHLGNFGEKPDIPYGYCHCGCGQKTKLHPFNARTRGIVKGEPAKYLANHYQCNSDWTFPDVSDEQLASGICAVGECSKPQHRYGVCVMHYQRWKRTKSFDLTITTDADRFWSKVDKSDESGCWNWTATKHRQGYGMIRINGKMVGSHRYSWEMHHGPVPNGIEVCHTCDNPTCVNPSHLFLGSHADNMLDRSAKGRAAVKLNEEQVRTMRARYANGERQAAIAADMGVDRSLVSLIVRRKAWAHVA